MEQHEADDGAGDVGGEHESRVELAGAGGSRREPDQKERPLEGRVVTARRHLVVDGIPRPHLRERDRRAGDASVTTRRTPDEGSTDLTWVRAVLCTGLGRVIPTVIHRLGTTMHTQDTGLGIYRSPGGEVYRVVGGH